MWQKMWGHGQSETRMLMEKVGKQTKQNENMNKNYELKNFQDHNLVLPPTCALALAHADSLLWACSSIIVDSEPVEERTKKGASLAHACLAARHMVSGHYVRFCFLHKTYQILGAPG